MTNNYRCIECGQVNDFDNLPPKIRHLYWHLKELGICEVCHIKRGIANLEVIKELGVPVEVEPTLSNLKTLLQEVE